MNSIFRNTLLAGGILLVSQAVLAQPAAPANTSWTGKGELGLVKTTGNTETESLLLGLEFVRDMERWRHRAAASALSAADSGSTTAERYQFEWQSDYKLNDKSWVLGALRYESDAFSAFDKQQTLTIGYGRKLLDNAVSQLNGEIGVGYRNAEDARTGESDSDAIIRGLLDYTRQVTDNTEFSNRLLVESGSNNTFIQNLMSLSVAMNDNFALKIGFEYRNNSDVPPGVDDTDTITSANLVYNFK